MKYVMIYIVVCILISVLVLGTCYFVIMYEFKDKEYDCITIDNEHITCEQVWVHDGMITGIKDNTTYIIKQYTERRTND